MCQKALKGPNTIAASFSLTHTHTNTGSRELNLYLYGDVLLNLANIAYNYTSALLNACFFVPLSLLGFPVMLPDLVTDIGTISITSVNPN